MTLKLLDIIDIEKKKLEAARAGTTGSKTSNKGGFRDLLKLFLERPGIDRDSINFLTKYSKKDYFKKINIVRIKKIYLKISKEEASQAEILEIFKDNERFLGFLFMMAAFNKDLKTLESLSPYNHLDFSVPFICFLKSMDRNDIYFREGSEFFFDIVLTNKHIKKLLENIEQNKDFRVDGKRIEQIKNKYYVAPNGEYWGGPDDNCENSLKIINIVNDYNFPPIDPMLFRIFKKHDFNFNMQNEAGNTPAHIYVYQLNRDRALSMVQLLELIKAGASLEIKNKEGLTFIDLWKSAKIQKAISNIKKNCYKDCWDPAKSDEEIEREANNGNIHYVGRAAEQIDVYVEKYLIEKELKARLKPAKKITRSHLKI